VAALEDLVEEVREAAAQTSEKIGKSELGTEAGRNT
jgi:hypothetical protein